MTAKALLLMDKRLNDFPRDCKLVEIRVSRSLGGHKRPDAVVFLCRRRRGAIPRFFHQKTGWAKTGASSCAATTNAVSMKLFPMFDRKKGPFLGPFCRKTGVSRKLFYTLFCVFHGFWDFPGRKPLCPSH